MVVLQFVITSYSIHYTKLYDSSLIRNPKATLPRKYLYSTYQEGNHTLYSKNFKYIRYADGGIELYDTCKDPGELENLAGLAEWSQLVNEMDAELNKELGQ